MHLLKEVVIMKTEKKEKTIEVLSSIYRNWREI